MLGKIIITTTAIAFLGSATAFGKVGKFAVKKPIKVKPIVGKKVPVFPGQIIGNQTQIPTIPYPIKIVKPIIKVPVGKKLPPVSPRMFGPRTRMTLELYDKNGNVNGSKVLTGKQLWNSLNTFTVKEINRFKKDDLAFKKFVKKQSQIHHKPISTTHILRKVKISQKLDSELGQRIETIEIPQDLAESKKLLTKKLMFKKAINTAVTTVVIPHAQTAVPYKKFSTSYNDISGNSDFSSFLNTNGNLYGARSSQKISGLFDAGGKVFGKRVSLIKFTTKVLHDTSLSTSAKLYVFGYNIWSRMTKVVKLSIRYERELGNRKRFWTGILPVSVGAAIGGAIGSKLKLSASNTNASAQIVGSNTPYIDSYGKAEASIGVWLARAGVEGSLRLLYCGTPVVAKAIFYKRSRRLSAQLTADNNLRALDGKISIYAKVRKFWGGWKKWTKTIFTWSGISRSWRSFNKRAEVPLS